MITPNNDNYFKSASYVFSKVKRDLSSFVTANLIDEGEFPTYVKEVLRMLGIGVYKEEQAMLKVKNYKAKLPNDFTQLYAAYKCTPHIEEFNHRQGSPISVYNDITWEILKSDGDVEINTINRDTSILERVTVRQGVKAEKALGFIDPVLLRPSPNVRRDRCAEDFVNALSTSPYEFTLADGFLYTNFADDFVFLKYYAFPKDEDGVPLILDNERLEKAVEWYIKAEVLKTMWFNGAAPDLENRWKVAEMEADKWFAEIKYERKMPSFAQMINTIRRNRAVNKIAIFA